MVAIERGVQGSYVTATGSPTPRTLADWMAFARGRTQIVATRGQMPGRAVIVASMTLHESKTRVKFGPKPCTDIRVAFPGFSLSTAAGGETDLPNDLTILGAIERISPNHAKFFSLNGQRAMTVAAGGGLTITDPVGMDFAADDEAQIQYEARFDSGDTALSQLSNLEALSNYSLAYRSSALTTGQVGTAGAWSVTDRGANKNVGGFSAILGVPTDPFPSALIVGDSIAEGREDNSTGDAYGNHGYIQRGLYDAGPGGSAVPWACVAVAGEKVSTIVAGGAAQRLTLLKYASHCILNMGVNDIADAVSLATLQDRYTSGWASIKRYGVRLYQCKITPRTTSSDSWATLANQTLATGHDVGGLRDQLNAWFDTQVGTAIDGVIDPNVYCESGSTGKWAVDGNANYATADGVHPSIAMCALMAQAVKDVAGTFTV